MSVDEHGQHHADTPANPDAERHTEVNQAPGADLSGETSAGPPAGVPGPDEAVVPPAELSHEALRRLRARLVRKYH